MASFSLKKLHSTDNYFTTQYVLVAAPTPENYSKILANINNATVKNCGELTLKVLHAAVLLYLALK